jgi:ABC-2 type transport system permease protein
MRKILTITWKDINVIFRDGAGVILMIAGPLVLTLGLGLITGSFGRDDAPTISRIPVLIVNQDGGALAAAFDDLMRSDDLGDLLAAEAWNDEAAALEQVRRGDAAAVVVIPAGFSDSLTPDPASGELPAPVALRVYGDPGAPIGAAVVRSIAEEFTNRVQTNVTAVRLALTHLATSGAVAPADLPTVGQEMSERLVGGDTAAPPITVRAESVETGGEAGFNALAFFAPAMALLFLMYAVTLGARTLISERREGTLARMLAAPVSTAQVLSGKVAGIFMTGFIQLGVLILLTTVMFRLNWGQPLGVLLLVVAAALAATGWGLLLASLSSNAGQITAMGTALMLIFGILGGSFVPGQVFGPALQWAGMITPNRWAQDGFVSLASGEGLAGIATPVSALLIMAVILFAVSATIFRRRQTSLLTG